MNTIREIITKSMILEIISLIVFIAYKVLSKYKLVEDKSKPEEKKQ